MRSKAALVTLLLLCVPLTGCAGPPDEDEDGVTDELDLCSLTPIDELVNDSGCSASQRDGDGDGVSDAGDLCMETPADEIPNESGCSATERDGDGDGFADADDSCPSTPANETTASDGCADSEVDMSMRPWWCHSTGTGHGEGQEHGDHLAPAYHGMTKGMLSWQDCIDVSEQFGDAIEWAMQWPTVADAEADGFHMAVDYVGGMGTHHVRLGNFSMDADFDPLDPEFPDTRMDDVFDFGQPEFLMYASSAQDAELVGFAWYVKTDSENPPTGFPGDNDWWHVHQMLCFTNSSFQVAGEDITDEECHSRGGTNVHLDDYWMTHAWIIEPWLTQFDVFTNHHPCLKGDGAETDFEDSCWDESVNGSGDDEGSEHNH
ncbi:MAG: thrombospondin type 3 repeat-containing protein [Arenicellales bacterium]|nr:thrombospondin type 3 repeat-containing protein [Arenicellales bacterium]